MRSCLVRVEIWNSCFKKEPSGGRFPKAGDATATTTKMTAERCEEFLIIATISGRKFNSSSVDHDSCIAHVPLESCFFFSKQGWRWAPCGHSNCVSAKFTVCTNLDQNALLIQTV